MKTEKINIRGVIFDDISLSEAVACAYDFMCGGVPRVIHTPNAEIVQSAIDDADLYPVINSADLIVPDGIGVILASKILKRPFHGGRVPGVELCEKLIALCAENGKRVFILGGKPGVAESAADNLRAKYPGLTVSGTFHGYFDRDGGENTKLVERIAASHTDFLLVCFGAPAQEIWIRSWRDSLNVPLIGGFGGSVDIFAGVAKRAPEFYCKHGLEWLYRLFHSPSRFSRMMTLPRFLFGTVFHR